MLSIVCYKIAMHRRFFCPGGLEARMWASPGSGDSACDLRVYRDSISRIDASRVDSRTRDELIKLVSDVVVAMHIRWSSSKKPADVGTSFEEAKSLGFTHLWLQPGAESAEVIQKASDLGKY